MVCTSLRFPALLLDIPYLRNVIYTASADPQTDKAAIEEAEKRLGAKEE